MSMTSKVSIPGNRERRGGLSRGGSSLRGLLLVALSGLFAATAALATPTLTAPAGIKPAGTPNADIATLNTQNVEFKWNRGGLGNGQIKEFNIFVGSLIGAFEIVRTDTPIAAVNDQNDYSVTLQVPANGGKRIFVRLSYTEIVNGVEVIKGVDYVINAAISPLVDGDEHFIYSPVPGSSLDLQDVDGCKAPPMVEFQWALAAARVAADEAEPAEFWFYVGNDGNNRAYFNSGRLSPDQRSITVANIPTDGSSVKVTLWWRLGADGAAWESSEFSYNTPRLPAITSPNPGNSLSGTSGNLELSPNGLPVRYFWIYAGPTRQSVDYLSDGLEVDPAQPQDTALAPFQNFPDDGSTVYVTLFWRLDGDTAQQWKCREYTYKASEGPEITSPATDTVLPTGSLEDPLDDTTDKELVEWDAKGTVAAGYQVVLNSSGDPNDNGVWQSGTLPGDATSVEIPKARFTTNGETIYIVLRYAVNGGLAEEVFNGFKVASYATRKAPYMTGPGGSTIPKCFTSGLGNEATFEWTDGNLADVQGYWVYVGNQMGDDSYANSGAIGTDVTSLTIKKGLPTDGSDVWVRLWYLIEVTVTTDSDTDTNVDPDSETGGSTTVTSSNRYASRDFLFQNPVGPEITAPGHGATISGTESGITFTTNGVAVRNLWVTASSAAPAGGDAKNPDPGVADLDSSGLLAPDATEFNIRNLPVDGSTVYITFWYLPETNPNVSVGWSFRTYAFVSSNATPPQMLTPDPTAEFNNGAPLTFTWRANDTVVTGWWLYVGNQGDGSSNLCNSGFLLADDLDQDVDALPFGEINCRLWYVDQLGNWNFIAYTLDNKANPPNPPNPEPDPGPDGPSGEEDGNGDNNGLG